MRHPFYQGVLLGSLVAVVVLMATTALAGTGVGAVFHLGKVNKVNRTSTLSGTTAKKMLQVTNKGSGPALGLTVKAGRPPLAVNSTARVKRLNADRLDGLHAADLRKVYTVRRDINPSAAYEEMLTVPGLVRISVLNYAVATGIMFSSLSKEWAYCVQTGYPVVHVHPGGQSSHGWVTTLGTASEQRYIFWDSQRAASVDVLAVRLYSDEITVIVQAIVQ